MDEDVYLSPEERRAKRRAEKAARARQAQDDAVVASILGSEAGRLWMWDVLGFCSIFHTTVAPNPHLTYLNEGRRQVGLMLVDAIVRASPAAYIQMMQEQQSGRRIPTLDRTDLDDERNYDESGRWVGDGPGPDPDDE